MQPAQIVAPLHDFASQGEASTFFYLFIGSCMLLLAVAVALVTVAAFFRRNPPIDAQFATKAEMNSAIAGMKDELHREVAGVKDSIGNLDARNENRSEAIFEKIDSIATSFDNGMREVHRALGRLEGDPSK